jgi:hypothetical protein
MKRKSLLGSSLIGLLLGSAFPLAGQQKDPTYSGGIRVEQNTVFQRRIGPEGPPPPLGDTFVFVASEMSFDGKPVAGAPYSAQAVTETTQTLSDGNRIVNKTTSLIYRDSEGRTRREQTLRVFGPFAAKGEAPQTIIISDPVAGVTYTLDPQKNVARKMPPFHFEFKTRAPKRVPGKEGEDVLIERVPGPGVAAGPGTAPEGPPPEMFTLRAPHPAPGAQFTFRHEGVANEKGVTEKLGTQIIEGVSAEGSRTTITIPAGEIGNERAIEIVSERWYSPDLKTVVMSRHSDPRFGETVYRLTNINRSEPVRTLFEVPADYTVKEEPVGPMRLKRTAPPAP